MDHIRGLSDKVLLEQCVKFGKEALLWRNKFRALLPEVERRRLYLRKGFKNIYEFGERLAGLSMAQVAESLNIAERLEDKPVLKGLLESGEVSVNKIVRVMSIATSENESELAEKVQLLSLSALKTYVQDLKLEVMVDHSEAPLGGEIQLQEHAVESTSHCALKLDYDVEQKLSELQEKGIDINQLLRETLSKREEELVQAKDQIAKGLPESSSRYIPTRVKNILKQEYGEKCSINRFQKPSENIHHMRRFSLSPSHDPNFMAPLCKEHHQIAHGIDVKYQEVKRRLNM